MSYREVTAYEWICDGCGDTVTDEVDELPDGWAEAGDGDHWCEGCA